MKIIQRITAAGLLFAASVSANALNILLTNDDGWNSPGIEAVRTALVAAGHSVTLVGPLNNQSGMGGSLNTSVGGSVAVVESGGPGTRIWSVDSTPADAVRAAFGGILTKAPDLVVSGINEGQNLGMTGTWGSGTVNAALVGMSYGVPAIAVSAERLLAQSGADTLNAMPAVASFVVRLVDRLQQTAMGGPVLPVRTLLNVNYPVFNAALKPGPIQSVQGVRFTNLATKSNLEFAWVGAPASSGKMTVSIDFANFASTKADPIANSDTDAMRAGFVSVSPMDGDMTSKSAPATNFSALQWRLNGLQP